MNFYSHLAIASLFTEDIAVAFGAMLPDFASMLGVRQPPTTDAGIKRGCELHHETDRLFHEHPLFREACLAETAVLRLRGFASGTARAVAHVGLEIFLDDALWEDGPARVLYAEVLASATPRTLCRSIEWKSPDQVQGFEQLRQRLLLSCSRTVPSAPPPLSERIFRALLRRPKLAVRADERVELDTWTAEAPQRSSPIWPIVSEAVVSGLKRAQWQSEHQSVRALRFPRAQGYEV